MGNTTPPRRSPSSIGRFRVNMFLSSVLVLGSVLGTNMHSHCGSRNLSELRRSPTNLRHLCDVSDRVPEKAAMPPRPMYTPARSHSIQRRERWPASSQPRANEATSAYGTRENK